MSLYLPPWARTRRQPPADAREVTRRVSVRLNQSYWKLRALCNLDGELRCEVDAAFVRLRRRMRAAFARRGIDVPACPHPTLPMKFPRRRSKTRVARVDGRDAP